MRGLVFFVKMTDRFSGWIGHAAAWLMIPVVLVAFGVVLMRYLFSVGYPWIQEVYIWLHGMAFMLATAWVLRDEGHVRVDLFYKRFSPRARAWADFAGVWLFLMPMMFVVISMSWPIVLRSWRMLERSPTADGLPFLYLLKSMVLVFCVLITLQGLALAGRSLLVILGREDLLARSGPGRQA
jgi:TRAP-type mannitol/chloroaromatic compound transport system permease small subunit